MDFVQLPIGEKVSNVVMLCAEQVWFVKKRSSKLEQHNAKYKGATDEHMWEKVFTYGDMVIVFSTLGGISHEVL